MPSEFADLVRALEYRLSQYRCMTAENPVLAGAQSRSLGVDEIEAVLSQYSLLPARISTFLTLGAQRLACWSAVRKELERNLGEEEGNGTGGVPHYQILCDALRVELGLDVRDVRPSRSTRHFLNDLVQSIGSTSPAFAAGVLYALEDSAVPELSVVAKIINTYSARKGAATRVRLARRPKPCEFVAGRITLSDFFAMHIHDFEIGHRDFLAEAVSAYLEEPTARAEFRAGFEHLMDAMETWWADLAKRSQLVALSTSTAL